MARINKELIILVGRDRENPRTRREAFEITGGLGEMLDKHIKRNNLNKSEFIREAVAAKLEAEMPKEPLIKDEKIRKAVRIWAEVNKTKYVWVTVAFDGISITQDERHPFPTEYKQSITFECEVNFKSGYYTIEELCGTLEPLEPTLIDLDERIKEKEEE